ncbi:MAG: hypothetical protein IH851_13105 [Armatimonadetes bacterium]|nr:hypothetical protein [Armatimonadota bacterium]
MGSKPINPFRTWRLWLTLGVVAIAAAALAFGVALWVTTQPPLSAMGEAPSGTEDSLQDRAPPGPEVEDSLTPFKVRGR